MTIIELDFFTIVALVITLFDQSLFEENKKEQLNKTVINEIIKFIDFFN